MDQHILCVFTRTKSFINRIVPFFSAGYYSRNLCKTIFFHDFFFAPENIFLPCYQDHIPNQRTFLKTAQRITEHRHPVKLHKLLLYFAVHSLSLACCQDNSRISALSHDQLPRILLSFAKLQVRNRIQIPAVACSPDIFIVSCHTDHRCVIRTEDR